MLIKTCDEYDKKRAKKYTELFIKLNKVTMNTTLQELSECCNCNRTECDVVVNLNEEVFTEWTW